MREELLQISLKLRLHIWIILYDSVKEMYRNI
nr:MAG TPA: hypothetical protein [Caudoviricetes sp.]